MSQPPNTSDPLLQALEEGRRVHLTLGNKTQFIMTPTGGGIRLKAPALPGLGQHHVQLILDAWRVNLLVADERLEAHSDERHVWKLRSTFSELRTVFRRELKRIGDSPLRLLQRYAQLVPIADRVHRDRAVLVGLPLPVTTSRLSLEEGRNGSVRVAVDNPQTRPALVPLGAFHQMREELGLLVSRAPDGKLVAPALAVPCPEAGHTIVLDVGGVGALLELVGPSAIRVAKALLGKKPARELAKSITTLGKSVTDTLYYWPEVLSRDGLLDVRK